MDVQTLIDAINAGTYDANLGKLSDAVQARLHASRKNKTVNDFELGSRVKFNELTGTRYMVGEYATVISKNRTKLVVRLENPTGRFAKFNPVTKTMESSNVSVPVAIVDLV